jgi:hypothetical protein
VTATICEVSHCQRPARWVVTIEGHPNTTAEQNGQPYRYCTEHGREKAGTLWEDSPAPYTVTVEGPYRPGQLP